MFFKSKAKKIKEEIEELEDLKQVKLHSLLISLVLILLGLVLVINPLGTAKTICFTIGSIILIAGIVFVIIYLVTDFKDNINKNKLVIGIILMIVGMIFFLTYKVIMSVIPTILGIVIFVNGLMKLQMGLNARRINKEGNIWMIVLSIVIILTGIFIVFNTFGTGKLILRVVGICLILAGITDIVGFAYLRKKISDYIKDKKALEQ